VDHRVARRGGRQAGLAARRGPAAPRGGGRPRAPRLLRSGRPGRDRRARRGCPPRSASPPGARPGVRPPPAMSPRPDGSSASTLDPPARDPRPAGHDRPPKSAGSPARRSDLARAASGRREKARPRNDPARSVCLASEESTITRGMLTGRAAGAERSDAPATQSEEGLAGRRKKPAFFEETGVLARGLGDARSEDPEPWMPSPRRVPLSGR
jgi:hypothetical protein